MVPRRTRPHLYGRGKTAAVSMVARGPLRPSRDSAAAMAAPEGPSPVPQIFSTMEEGARLEGRCEGQEWLQSHGRALGHFVGGTWLKPAGRGTLESREAATGLLLATLPQADDSDLAAAVQAAAEAAQTWGGLGGAQRSLSLQRLAQSLQEAAGGLGAVAALGGGRPLAQTLGPDLALALQRLKEAAGGALLSPPGWAPLGVVAVVPEGSCSLAALLGVLGPLLAMGNTALVLPPPEAALLPLLLAELGGGPGGALPPGVLNVVTATPALRPALQRHPQVAKVTFLGTPQEPLLWGSPRGGPQLGGGPRGGLLLVLVLDSADLDSAAAALVGAMGTPPPLGAGGSLAVLVQEGLGAELLRRLRRRLGGLRLGDPRDPRTQLGPLCPPPAPGPPRVEELLRAAREEGAEVFQPPLALPPGGLFCPPTLICGLAPTSSCLREQPPPQLLPLLLLRSGPEAVAVASRLPQASAASIWAQDLSQALEVADRLPLDLLWLNSINPLELGTVPGGGLEALLEFGRPPWDPPKPSLEPEPDPQPAPGGPPQPPDPPALAQAMDAARKEGRWAELPGHARAAVLRLAAARLGGGANADVSEERLRAGLRRWAELVELRGGTIQDAPGGRRLITRRPLGVVGMVWSGPRPLPRALELLPPALALGNRLVLLAPPAGMEAALRLRQALVASGLPGGVLTVLRGGAAGEGAELAQQRPEGLWLCGGGTDPDWASVGGVPHVWVPGGVLGGLDQDPPPGAELELELRCSRPKVLWLPGGGA